MDTYELLFKARERIAQGWIQGRARDAWGNACILGALAAVKCDNDLYRRAAKIALVEEIDDTSPRYSPRYCTEDTIANFNDATTTTKEDVLALFDKTLAKMAPAPDAIPEPTREVVAA